MKFWDASAIVPLCVNEPQTPLLKEITKEDGAIVAWWATPIECYSAFARLRREGLFSRVSEERARKVLASLAAEWTEIEPARVVLEQAARALLLHPLRASDSLQLAAALVWTQSAPAGRHFVCLDDRLRQAAHREGFWVLPHDDNASLLR